VFKDIEGYLMKGFANSFTYTKSLSEFIIQEQFSDLPVSIVRPAIIGSTWHEPFQVICLECCILFKMCCFLVLVLFETIMCLIDLPVLILWIDNSNFVYLFY